MAIRKIRLEGDPVLGKKCRPVEVMTDKLQDRKSTRLNSSHA